MKKHNIEDEPELKVRAFKQGGHLNHPKKPINITQPKPITPIHLNSTFTADPPLPTEILNEHNPNIIPDDDFTDTFNYKEFIGILLHRKKYIFVSLALVLLSGYLIQKKQLYYLYKSN